MVAGLLHTNITKNNGVNGRLEYLARALQSSVVITGLNGYLIRFTQTCSSFPIKMVDFASLNPYIILVFACATQTIHLIFKEIQQFLKAKLHQNSYLRENRYLCLYLPIPHITLKKLINCINAYYFYFSQYTLNEINSE